MTTFSAELAAISRTPVTLAVMTLDYCGRTFGVSPCTATGTPCYNTFPTCKLKTAYLKSSKDYKFTSASAPLPFRAGERPYLKNVKYLPTEIKDNLTINARITLVLHDEPDTDVGIDPYVAQRASVQGTFWKKMLARNLNYKGRMMRIYQGFIGLAEAAFQLKWLGTIDNITLSGSEVKIEVRDLLKQLSDIEVPPKLDIKLVTDITASQVEITLTTVAGLDSAGYVRIDNEIIYYTATNPVTNIISGCQRGFFSTVAAIHKAKAKVQKVRYYAPANPFDILQEMLLTDAAIPSAYVDTTAFTYWRNLGGDVNFSAIISEPTKLDKLYYEIIDLIDCKSWVGEDLRITIRRNFPNLPGRSTITLTDAANIVHDSGAVDFNVKSRISRALIYWDKTALGAIDKVEEYNRLDIAIDATAESANDYNEIAEKKFFCRWMRTGYMQDEVLERFARVLVTRHVRRYRDAMPIIQFDVEMKDSEIKTGDFVSVTTDELLLPDGNPLSNALFQIVRRDVSDNIVTLKALRYPARRIGFFAPTGTPAYGSATEAQRARGFFTRADGTMTNNDIGYYFY